MHFIICTSLLFQIANMFLSINNCDYFGLRLKTICTLLQYLQQIINTSYRDVIDIEYILTDLQKT